MSKPTGGFIFGPYFECRLTHATFGKSLENTEIRNCLIAVIPTPGFRIWLGDKADPYSIVFSADLPREPGLLEIKIEKVQADLRGYEEFYKEERKILEEFYGRKNVITKLGFFVT